MADIERIEIALGKKLPKPAGSINEAVLRTGQSFFGVPAMMPPQEQIEAFQRGAIQEVALSWLILGLIVYIIYRMVTK